MGDCESNTSSGTQKRKGDREKKSRAAGDENERKIVEYKAEVRKNPTQ